MNRRNFLGLLLVSVVGLVTGVRPKPNWLVGTYLTKRSSVWHKAEHGEFIMGIYAGNGRIYTTAYTDHLGSLINI